MKLYQVIYQNDQEDIDRNIFHVATLEMCRPSYHCGCFDRGEMDSCDHMFTETKEITIAEDKVNHLLKYDNVLRAWIKKVESPVIVKKGLKK